MVGYLVRRAADQQQSHVIPARIGERVRVVQGDVNSIAGADGASLSLGSGSRYATVGGDEGDIDARLRGRFQTICCYITPPSAATSPHMLRAVL